MTKRLIGAAMGAVLGLMTFSATAADAAARYWQCVPYARLVSGIQIFGDAHTWWSQAQGHYRTGARPEVGAVLSFRSSGRMRLGHVAVVRDVLTDRVIRVTHANWGGSRGQIERDVVVVDVSDAGDWSQVKVWYNPSEDTGGSVYPVNGFIYPDAPLSSESIQIASVQAEQGSL